MTDTQVRITPDGAALIDAEPIDVPPGTDPARVVLQQLALDAAGSGGPIAATIHDTRTDQRLRLQINPDGSTRPLAPGEPILPPAPAPPAQNSASPEHDRALEAVYEAGRAHDFTRAAAQADRLLADLTATHGERHPATLTTAGVRADLAWMSGDYRYAAELWTYIAQGWAQTAGPASRPARSSARQAAASWKDVPDSEALASGQPLLEVLTTIAPSPETNPTVLAVRRRISLLTPA
ncbi:hypothetical protein [Kitasatospora herbaricolor]|uniref:Tetratricopeptide repeat protein n=1 Tax=Kitasatospora herbaricolor TaxID=68217 RepID=A0ABZ1W0L3_9ACTN|nr:hypothetical protein [Kitasatospora herbaricolor]